MVYLDKLPVKREQPLGKPKGPGRGTVNHRTGSLSTYKPHKENPNGNQETTEQS